MDIATKNALAVTACKIRRGAITAVHAGHSGHPGGSLSIAEVLAYLYFHEMRLHPDDPRWADRDRFVLSKGHCTPALYTALALRGYFPLERLLTFRQLGGLQGHPDMNSVPGVDMSTGSLGQGISAACGMALSARISRQDYRVYAIMGDGEIEEGQVWEAAMFAKRFALDNLVAYVDFNGLQSDGKVEDILSPWPLPEKFEAFGWHTLEIDGHDLDAIATAYDEARATKGRPTVIIAHSVKGKGVSFMENAYQWHGVAPDDAQFAQAMKELDEALAKLEGVHA